MQIICLIIFAFFLQFLQIQIKDILYPAIYYHLTFKQNEEEDVKSYMVGMNDIQFFKLILHDCVDFFTGILIMMLFYDMGKKAQTIKRHIKN